MVGYLVRKRLMTAMGICALAVVLLSMAGCDFRVATPATFSQGNGLPTLRYLNWGAAYYAKISWSPDGQWMAREAGDDLLHNHLEVASRDGHQIFNLSEWGCDPANVFYEYAWLPDGRLSCIVDNERKGMCIGAYPFRNCSWHPFTTAIDASINIIGSDASLSVSQVVWALDGKHLLLSADVLSDTNPDPVGGLCVVDNNGVVTQLLPFDVDGFYSPQWRPHTTTISYILGSDIVLSSTTWSNGQFTLSKPKTIVPDDFTYEGYSWSPSGRWIATRSGVVGKDKIYLINADHPEQTVDVALAENIPQIIGSPVWSPDGKTLLVMDESNDQPYTINIADYLHSKGLDV